MPSFSIVEIKKALVAAGIELYRTRGQEVHVADRVRENLIMDSRVSVSTGDSPRVRFVVRAERSAFPAEATPVLFDRARALAVEAVRRGYIETGTATSPVTDPADPTHHLDTWYEVVFEKAVSSVDDAVAEVKYAVVLEKAVRAAAPA
jgi:hypothetical protein